MKDFFKPEDFHCEYHLDKWYCSSDLAAKIANSKRTNEIQSWPVVILGDEGNHPSHNKWVIDDGGFDMSKFTKKARLAFIEEIKKEPCKHEPREVFWSQEREYHHYDCKHCGVELQATWIEVKK